MTIGQAGKKEKSLNVNWHLQFDDQLNATNCFERLKQTFAEVFTYKRFSHDNAVGSIAEFSSTIPGEVGIKDVSLYLYESFQTKKWEISLLFRNDLLVR